ncbi:MAG: DUF362 domain-containing protein [Candidatus Hodarchaeota archaeon]
MGIKEIDNIRNEYAIKKGLWDLLDLFSSHISLSRDSTVMIKVNLCLLMGPETGATVDPVVAKILCKWLLKNYQIRRIYIGEADATHLSADLAFKILGWEEIFHNFKKVELLNLSKDDQVKVQFQGLSIKNPNMSTKYMHADYLISLAKLKTHTQQRITCIMKNHFGAMSEKYKVKYHPQLSEAICDMVKIRPADLSVIDGLVGMEGNGPTNGVPRISKLLIVGSDPVATDLFAAKVMGAPAARVPHLKLAKRIGLGESDYSVMGQAPPSIRHGYYFMPLWKQILKKSLDFIRDRNQSTGIADG